MDQSRTIRQPFQLAVEREILAHVSGIVAPPGHSLHTAIEEDKPQNQQCVRNDDEAGIATHDERDRERTDQR